MKRLIVCADGTWNAPRQEKDGGGLTNVAKVRDTVADRDAAGIEQRCYYHAGVGTSGSTVRRWIDGAFGTGLSDNVIDCYQWVAENFEVGDELFLFGFSRGAFTVRSVAGFIRNCGIPRAEHRARIPELYRYYRDRAPSTAPDAPQSVELRAKYSMADIVPIKCIAVWDTVGALGVPTPGPIGYYTRRKYGFHDVRLSSTVQNGFHALAIDERRKPFAPSLWGVRDSVVRNPKRQQRVEQRWFPGVHSNVGGGYPDVRLSDLALGWMLGRAAECGLALAPSATAVSGHCCGTLYDSQGLLWKALGTYVREIAAPRIDTETKEPLHTFEDVMSCAWERKRSHVPPKYAPPYDPANLRNLQPS